MREFDFLQPATVNEASRMQADLGDDARVMAGGTALMLALRQRMLSPTHLISVAGIQALRGIRVDPALGLRIGALSRHDDVARSPLVRQHAPMLASMAAQVADPQVRNQGTIGGNLCYADPATDPPGCLLALGASVVLGSQRGERVLPISDFLVDYYVTALQADELVVEIRVPPQAADAHGLYTRFLRTAAEHRPLVNVALLARRDGLLCRGARIVVGASTPIAQRQHAAEALLEGRRLTPQLAADVANRVAQDIEPITDLRGSAEHRREMVRAVTRRSLCQLFGLPIDEVNGEMNDKANDEGARA